MTLSAPKDRSGPIFDCIPPISVVEKYPVRRLPTLAQRSLLSEKHIPLKPSVSPFFRKCYCSSSLELYKLNKQYDNRNVFIEMLSSKRHEEQFIQFHDLNKFSKIRQTAREMPLFESSVKINSQLASFSELSLIDIRSLNVHDALREHGKFRNRNLSFSFIRPPECLTIKNSLNCLKFSAAAQDSYTLTCPRDILSFFAASIYSPNLSVVSFGPIKNSFDFFSAHKNSFSLQFSSTKLPTTDQQNFIQQSSQTPTSFQPQLDNANATFDFRHEIGKNLIIGTRPDLTAFAAVKTCLADRPQKPAATMKLHDKSGLIKHSFPSKFVAQPLPRNHVFIPTLELRPTFILRINPQQHLQKAQNQALANIIAQPAEKKSWLRLKLRLHKFLLSSTIPRQVKPVIKRPVLACIMGSRTLDKIQLTMPPINKERPLTIRQETIGADLSHTPFCRKADRLLLKTRSQALYTKKIMSKLIAVDAFKKSRKQYFEPGRLGLFNVAGKLADILENSSSTLVEDITHIRIRPLRFFMQISAMDFTDIALPLNRRRLVPPRGLFPASFGLNAKPGSLMPLRIFSAASVTQLLQLPSTNLKPARRITTAFVQLKHFARPVHQLPLCSTYSSRANCCDKKAMIATESKLDNFHFSSTVPDSICIRLKLNFAILDDKNASKCLMLNFCAPPDWEKSSRNFSCRLRLMPFAFGFPHFSTKQFQLKPIYPAFEPQLKSSNTTSLKLHPYYSLPYSKHYYHPLSQKNPRKWLYSQTTTETLKAESYKSSAPGQFLEVSNLVPPAEFAYTWFIQKSSKLFYQARPLHQEKIWPENIHLIEKKPIISEYSQRKLKNTGNIEYSGIRRFLLKIPNNADLRLKKESFSLGDSAVCKRFKPDDVKYCKDFKPPFISLYRKFSTICRDVLAFGHKLSILEKLRLNKLTRYNAMFRVFRFPYVPDYSKVSSSLNEDCFSLEDASTEMNDSFSDDIRARQISCAFDILQNSLEFTLPPTPVNYRAQISHANLENKQASDFSFNSEIFLCSRINKGYKKREASIPAKYIFFPKHKTDSYHYSFQSAQKPASTFSRPEPPRFSLGYILRSRIDQDFTRQDPGSIHWVIMLKNFMHISQQALRYVKRDFNTVFANQNTFALSLPAKSLNDYRIRTCPQFSLFSAQVPVFFARSLKHDSIASALAELDYEVLSSPTAPPVFVYESTISHGALSYVHGEFKDIRFAGGFEHSPATIPPDATHQVEKIKFNASFPVESGVKKNFANMFHSPRSNAERFRHPGYPEWIDMDIDVLPKKADSNKDNVKFLLFPLRH